MVAGSILGGILWLFELIEEHRPEFAFDFRTKFNLSIEDLGKTYTYREAFLLTAVLMRDTTSWVQAAVNEWRFPASPEWIMQVQSFDAFVAVNSKNPKPTPMPWQAPIRSGKPAVSDEKVREILNSMRPEGA